ncbi:MAG TPA: hypothetical protein VF092_26260 [Longimicrobium sp.]
MSGSDCGATAQALHSAVPQVGIAVAGGNPLPGTASVGGVRLGFLPRVTADVRLTAAWMTLPDITLPDPAAYERTDVVPSVNVDAAVSLTQGLPGGVAGLGAIDLLLSAGLLTGAGPLEGTSLGYGGGVRVGILRETFGTPAVNVSAMYRRVDGVRYRAAPRELEFDVRDVSLRATVAKRVARIGLVGGAGYDRFTGGDARFSYAEGSGFVSSKPEEGRWSLFGNVSLPLTVGAVTLEGGWMSGGDAIEAAPPTAAYDPGKGTIFGSLALRLSL